MKKIAIITTHPIQYNAPLFSLLSKRNKIHPKVFYTWGEDASKSKFDPGFGKQIKWDIPLLDEYEFIFTRNISKDPGSHHFNGIDNPDLIKEIIGWGPDAILIYGWAFKSHLKCIRYFHNRIPVFFRGDSTSLNNEPYFKKMIKSFFLRWVYSKIDIAFYVGSRNKEYYKKFGVPDMKLIYAPHAVDNDRFLAEADQKKEDAKNWRERLKIYEGDTVFLFAGKLEPVKNVNLLLKAFLIASQSNCHLIICGNGILEKEFKDKYGLLLNIHFIDFQNQILMPTVYRLADVFVLPSHSETWGLSINEAMNCGLAIITSDKCGAATDLIEEGVNGFIFKDKDVDQLSYFIKEMAKDRPSLATMGENSIKKISKFSYCNFAEKLEKELN